MADSCCVEHPKIVTCDHVKIFSLSFCFRQLVYIMYIAYTTRDGFYEAWGRLTQSALVVVTTPKALYNSGAVLLLGVLGPVFECFSAAGAGYRQLSSPDFKGWSLRIGSRLMPPTVR